MLWINARRVTTWFDFDQSKHPLALVVGLIFCSDEPIKTFVARSESRTGYKSEHLEPWN
jgi:hypothetical protein